MDKLLKLYNLGKKCYNENKRNGSNLNEGYYLDYYYRNLDIPDDEKKSFLKGWIDACEECKNVIG